jgi:hypothetical protein
MLFLLWLTVRLLTRLLVLPNTDDGTKDLEILVPQHQLRVLRPWGAEIHSCTSSVLVQEPAEQMTPTDLTLADDTNAIGIGGRTRRSQPERPVGADARCSASHARKTCSRWRRPTISSQSRHSARTVPIHRSATALVLGARTGVKITSASSERKRSSKAAAELGVTVAQQELDSSSLLAEHQQ